MPKRGSVLLRPEERSTMAKKNVAYDTLWPTDTRIVVRACFLYVGQGSSILMMVREGTSYRALLIDSNLDKGNGGIDVPKMLGDLLPDKKLYAFVNTHPHDDHLCGVKQIREELTVENVWHSGHIPSKKYGAQHPELEQLIDKVKSANGDSAITEIDGSRSPQTL